jgi:branched-chain amino acid transport system ATP-binding protein
VLEVDELRSGYGRIEVLHGVSLQVNEGEVVTLVGANGAGKTTLLRAISGVQPVTGGEVRFEGKPIDRIPAHKRVELGIAQVPEGRQLFAPLSVEDHLRLGAWSRRGTLGSGALEPELRHLYELFPMLAELRHVAAGTLSGGQQQMLAIGRALMAKPKLLLLDEPSMGLAPILVDQILSIVRSLKADGMTILLVEQNARAALAIADRGYVVETGRIAAEGSAASLLADGRVQAAYLGV